MTLLYVTMCVFETRMHEARIWQNFEVLHIDPASSSWAYDVSEMSATYSPSRLLYHHPNFKINIAREDGMELRTDGRMDDPITR